jgi:SAM-dependent methyltransferase
MMPLVPVHPFAARGFRDADAYERGRPDYPAEAIDWLSERLELGPGATVVDVGAGTGKLTRQLLATGARVIAVEPLEEMRRVLARAVPGAEVVAGSAEAIPLPDASVGAVTAGQAAHWFRPQAATEIARVLRPGGGVGLIWNERDLDDPLQRAIDELVGPPRERAPALLRTWGAWREGFERGPFTAFERRDFRNVHELAADDLPAFVASFSYVGGLPAAEATPLLERARALAPGDRVTLRFRTDAYYAAKTER